MNVRKLHHPSDESVVRTVPAVAARSWRAAGWVDVAEPKPTKGKALKPATKPAPPEPVKDEEPPVLKVNHQHD